MVHCTPYALVYIMHVHYEDLEVQTGRSGQVTQTKSEALIRRSVIVD